MDRYIFVSNAILDKEKITWIDRDDGTVKVHFVSGESDTWDGENARIIWTSFEPERGWKENI
jgi:hypothetical protein